MTTDLPDFAPTPYARAEAFIQTVLSDKAGESALEKLIARDDNSFRAVFRQDYFFIAEDAERPSKSQWNTLKKKMKRHNPTVFVFKEYGYKICSPTSLSWCCYIDFGFFTQPSSNT